MSGLMVGRLFALCTIVAPACNSLNAPRGGNTSTNIERLRVVDLEPNSGGPQWAAGSRQMLPARYARAFTCDFDEDPVIAANRYHATAAGHAQREADLKLLRSLGFARQGRDGNLQSIGGRIAAPLGFTILGLPVKALEINGMVGDANAMYVTTFAAGVTVAQVVGAAHLKLDHTSYEKYRIRHYSRQASGSPYAVSYLDDRSGKDVLLTCQVQSTPD